MNTNDPKVSIVLAVYNGEKYLKPTLNSILAQTYQNWECILVNDSSTDSTLDILNDYAVRDARFKVHTNEVNLRLAKSLNQGISQASGKYIARMDADDICLPKRLEKQVEFMESHPNLALSYTKFFTLKDHECRVGTCGRNNTPEDITAMLLFFNPVLHPSVMARRDIITKYPYDPNCTCTEDMDLWTRMVADQNQIGCVDDFLFLYRIHSNQITANSKMRQCSEVSKIAAALYHKTLFDLTGEEIEQYISSIYFRDKYNYQFVYQLYRRIIQADKSKLKISNRNINRAVCEVLAEIHRNFPMSFKDKLGMLRFGGLDFPKELISKKLRTKKDVAKAEQAAAEQGFTRVSSAEVLPVFDTAEKYV